MANSALCRAQPQLASCPDNAEKSMMQSLGWRSGVFLEGRVRSDKSLLASVDATAGLGGDGAEQIKESLPP